MIFTTRTPPPQPPPPTPTLFLITLLLCVNQHVTSQSTTSSPLPAPSPSHPPSSSSSSSSSQSSSTPCSDDTTHFTVNCTAPQGADFNGSASSLLSFEDATCSKISLQLLSLHSTLSLCPSSACDGCLFLERTTELTSGGSSSNDSSNDISVSGGSDVPGGYQSGLYTLSVRYWRSGESMSTLWMSNLFTPSFSETYVPLPSRRDGDYLTVHGEDQQGGHAFTYAVCVLVTVSPCSSSSSSSSSPSSTDGGDGETASSTTTSTPSSVGSRTSTSTSGSGSTSTSTTTPQTPPSSPGWTGNNTNSNNDGDHSKPTLGFSTGRPRSTTTHGLNTNNANNSNNGSSNNNNNNGSNNNSNNGGNNNNNNNNGSNNNSNRPNGNYKPTSKVDTHEDITTYVWEYSEHSKRSDDSAINTSGFIAGLVSLSVLLTVACVLLALLVFLQRRTLLAKFKQSVAAEILTSPFQRSESREQMVTRSTSFSSSSPNPSQRAMRRLNSLALSNSITVQNFDQFRASSSEDAESGGCIGSGPAAFASSVGGSSSPGQTRSPDKFYIEVFGPEPAHHTQSSGVGVGDGGVGDGVGCGSGNVGVGVGVGGGGGSGGGRSGGVGIASVP